MIEGIKMALLGLDRRYYQRNFIFGLIFPIIGTLLFLSNGKSAELSTIIFMIVNCLLYPYARFVYESVVSFIVGDNVFTIGALIFLLFKFITMAICWLHAIFIAPFGLLYLYFHQKKLSRND